MPETAFSQTRATGRPRNKALDEAILKATLELLAEVGYEGLALTEVARRAEATPPALYRRYSGKLELVSAALAYEIRTIPSECEDTGSFHGDLVALMSVIGATFTPFRVRVLTAALLASQDHPQLREQILIELESISDREWSKLMKRAFSRGELSSDRVSSIIKSLPAAYITRHILYKGTEPSAQSIEALVVEVIMPAILKQDHEHKTMF